MRSNCIKFLPILCIAVVLSSCAKERAVVIDTPESGTKVIEEYTYTPGEFADYAYDKNDDSWGTFYLYFLRAFNGIVKSKNMLLGAKMSVDAGNSNAAWGYKRYTLLYKSVDAVGKPVELSETVIAPVGIGWDHRPDKVFLANHYTIFADYERPTGDYADYLTGVAASDAIFICPDFEGYGATADRPHPFLAHDALARQMVDGAVAALKFLEKEGIKPKEGYKVYNGGYSQGGSSALAVHKYLETKCSDEEKALLPLEKSYCGGGPYSPSLTFKWYVSQEEAYYKCLFPMLIIGMKYSFPEIMKNVEVEDFFTQKFLDAGVLDMVRSKEYSSSYLRPYIVEKVGPLNSDILSEDALREGAPAYEALLQALEQCDLTEGWTPQHPVVLYHTTIDQYVPYANAEAAVNGLGENVTLMTIPAVEELDPHNFVGSLYFTRMVLGNIE